VMGVYEPASGRRLPLTQGAALPASIDGEGVLEISHFTQKSTTE
jgi:hypothetical protein